MNTRELSREQISALADGELGEGELSPVLVSLRRKEEREDWDIYHQIGDILRSQEMAIEFSPGFSARMSAALEAESVIVAPLTANAAFPKQRAGRTVRWAVSSFVAAAAMAGVAFFTTPPLMVALKGGSIDSEATTTSAMASSTNIQGDLVTATSAEGIVLRDPRVDDYLIAHQRFSPSLYSTAQFARSATFATDSNK